MAESLKQKATKGLIWSGIERLSGQIVSFVLALILARLVTPADYGVLAIVMVFVTVSGVMVDAGFANALIRKIDCTDIDRSTVLYFNIAVSIVIYAILYLSSPLIANLYDKPELVSLVRCASIIVVINSLGIVQQATLTSRIDFKKQTYVSLTSSVVSGVTGIVLAYNGYGVWALVVQSVLASTIRVLMLWIMVAWKPLLVFSKESFKDLFGYSYKLMFSNLIVQGGKQAIQLLLGRFYSVADLGYYNYANRLGSFIPLNSVSTIQRVLFPVFSQMQDDDDRLSANFRKSLVLSMSIIVPIMFGIAAMAEPIIKILLTDEWLPTIPLLRIVCITMAIWPLLYFNMNILWVKKRSDLSLQLEIINVVFRVGIVISLFRLGILWVCIALCIAEVLNFIMYAYYAGKVNSYNLPRQIKDTIPIFINASLSYVIVRYFAISNISNNLLCIGIGSILMIAIYILLTKLFQGTPLLFAKQIFNQINK